MKRLKPIALVVLVLVVGGAGLIFFLRKPVAAPSLQEGLSPAPAQTVPAEKTFDKQQYSLTEPSSPWVIVNKDRPLAKDYRPADLVTPKVTLNSQKTAEENSLRAETAKALEELFAEADGMGFRLMLASGFRSYALQGTYYNGYVARDGQTAADRYSARPGTSEHQTGLSLDISRADRKCYLEQCFGELAEGKWLAENAYKHGLILRYPAGQEAITGYQYEPWHFRYVGKELAAELHKNNQTLEEFFEL